MSLSRFLSLLLAFFLGFLSCIGAIAGVGYYAYAKVSFDKLEKWGLVKVDEEQYIDENADVDLTAMTIKAFLAEIKELQDLDKTVSIDLLVERWGLKIPDEIMQKIPTGVRSLAVKEIFSPNGIKTILENTDVSYLFQFLPGDVLAEPARETLAGKTLQEVVDLNLTNLLTGMKLGYLFGVQYQKDGSGLYIPVYKDPANPTLLELMGSIDLGRAIDVVGNGGDMLTVINDGMSDVLVDLLIKSVSSSDNSTMTRLLAGKTIGDLIVEDETTGAVSLDLGVVINGKKVGDLLGYTPVYLDDDADRGIVIDWTDENGDNIKGALRAIADGTVNGFGAEFDVDALLSNAYLGFFQEFDPVFDTEGNITGWLDGDGNQPDRLQRTLANKKLTTLLGDGFTVSNMIGGLFVGDLMGYTPVEDGDGNITGWLDKNGGDLDRVTEALAKLSVEKLTGGDFEYNDALEGLYVGDLLKYTPERADPTDPDSEIVGWYKDTPGDLDRVSDSLAKKKITDLTGGDFEVADVLEGLYVGDLLKYTPVKDDLLDPEKITGWLDKDGNPVTGIDRATANIDLYRLIDDDTYKVTDSFNELYMGEAMSYYQGELLSLPEETPARYQWYKTKDPVSGDLSNPTTGIEQKLANHFLGDLINGTVTADSLTNGMPLHELLSLHAVETPLYDADGNPLLYTTGEHVGEQATVKIWYDKNDVRQSDTISALAYCTIDGISAQVNAVKVGGVTGLTLFEENWYKAEFRNFGVDDDRYCLSPATGVLPSLADLTIGDLSDNDLVTNKIKAVRVGDAMGYTFYDGVWYTDSAHTTPVTGMMKAIAPKTVGNMETIGDDTPIGDLLGYTKVGPVWYETYSDDGNPANDVKASGIMASISDFYINGLGENVKTIRIGSILEYYRYESDDPLDPNYGTWYQDEERTIPADGIMAKFAELTVEDMKDSGKVTAKTKTILIGDAMGYSFSGGVWYTDDTHATPVTGMMKALAPKTVGEMNTVSSTIPIGELLGYVKVDGVWYENYVGPDDPANEIPSGVISAICDSYVDTLSADIEDMQLGRALSYYKYENQLDPSDPKNGKWYTDRAYTNEATGVMASFADLRIRDLSDETQVSAKSVNVVIGYAMGYSYVGGIWYSTYTDDGDPGNDVPVTGIMKTLAPKRVGELNTITGEMTVGEMMGYDKYEGVWYTDSTHTAKVTGIMRVISDFTIDHLDDDIDTVFIGDVMGYYTSNPENPKLGVWYQDEAKTIPAVGIMTAFASLTIAEMKDPDEVTNAVKTVTVGEAMGFKKVGGIWYSTYIDDGDPGNVEASGVIKAVADSTIGSLETDLNNTKIGEILDYTYNEGEHWWYDGLEPTSTMVNTISDTKINQLGSKLSNLTVSDMFSDTERASGFLSLLPADARLDELGGSGPNSMTSIFSNTTMGDYVDKGLITFSLSTQAKLSLIDPNWENRTIQGFIDNLINSVPALP